MGRFIICYTFPREKKLIKEAIEDATKRKSLLEAFQMYETKYDPIYKWVGNTKSERILTTTILVDYEGSAADLKKEFLDVVTAKDKSQLDDIELLVAELDESSCSSHNIKINFD